MDKLLQAYKLSFSKYEEYLMLCRDTGTAGRKRNLDVLRANHEKAQLRKEVEERAKRLRSNKDLFQEFKKAQTAAKKKFQNFKKVCKVVYKKKGAHSGL